MRSELGRLVLLGVAINCKRLTKFGFGFVERFQFDKQALSLIPIASIGPAQDNMFLCRILGYSASQVRVASRYIKQFAQTSTNFAERGAFVSIAHQLHHLPAPKLLLTLGTGAGFGDLIYNGLGELLAAWCIAICDLRFSSSVLVLASMHVGHSLAIKL